MRLVSVENALKALGRPFSDHDFSVYDLDAPFPKDAVAAAGLNSQQSATQRILAQAEAEKLTLRQVALRVATPRSQFVGTPQTVADALERWFQGRGADGFMIFESLPGQLEVFVETVVPLLQARGLFRTEYAGPTLRQNLGIAEPENRYAAARRNTLAAE